MCVRVLLLYIMFWAFCLLTSTPNNIHTVFVYVAKEANKKKSSLWRHQESRFNTSDLCLYRWCCSCFLLFHSFLCVFFSYRKRIWVTCTKQNSTMKDRRVMQTPYALAQYIHTKIHAHTHKQIRLQIQFRRWARSSRSESFSLSLSLCLSLSYVDIFGNNYTNTQFQNFGHGRNRSFSEQHFYWITHLIWRILHYQFDLIFSDEMFKSWKII